MADAALLDLLHHLTWQPPAIVGPAPVAMGRGAADESYNRFLAESEASAAAWREEGLKVRAALWQMTGTESGRPDLQALTAVIDGYERHLRSEARRLRRMERWGEQDVASARPGDQDLVRGNVARLMALAYGYYREAQDFALFLRAVRAELDADARGGPAFDDPDALEAYLLSALA
ncbi:hypothetical protein [Methylobacterium platani]|uniref:Uncharacterized protein n=2 Tax=Methylobacterium platani TaxID=427683 RepID=A0A179RY18_9HYPH|nr:hypothetical protein [Methylobacterium platani]KMO15086.1 hypothetical protein SQ03_17900 [Methylobacterium platani JCM 14648]OAS14776.1 hypothetical protein A5481_30130 [Methylobacterium platani]